MSPFAPAARPGIVYSATTIGRILGIPSRSPDPVPDATDGEVVLWFGGWDLPTLRASPVGAYYLTRDRKYDEIPVRMDPGYYRLLLPAPDTVRKTWFGQVARLVVAGDGWRPAPAILAVTALLAHLARTGDDLLPSGMCRCAEMLPGGRHLGLGGLGNVMVGSTRDRDCSDHLALAAFKAC